MSTKTEPKKITLNINGQDFAAVEKQFTGRSAKKEQPYLQFEFADWAAITRFVAVAGQKPLTDLVGRLLNAEIAADATNAAYTKGADGVWNFDRAVAVREIQSATTDSVRLAKDELKEQLEAARGEFNTAMNEVLELAAKNQPIPPSLLNKASVLKAKVAGFESKLAKKPKAAASATPAAPAK